jgi:CubicO group peptidase (beta-lactamase class C family)
MHTQRLILLPFVILMFLVGCGAPTVANAPTPPGSTGLSPTVQPPRTPPTPMLAADTTELLAATSLPSNVVSTLPAATLLPSDVISTTDAFLNRMLKARLFSGSVLIARNGEILLRKGYGMADRDKQIPNTPQTKFRLGSITKQFTAMAILMLQEQGKLQVQNRICTYFSKCPTAWQEITIHHLLTHTSGIPNFTDFPDYQKTKQSPSSPTQTIGRFNDKPLDFQPGTKWSYSNSGYIVLGFIIEQVSGQSYEMFLREHIFGPLKMMDTGYEHNNDLLAVGYANTVSKADAIDMSIPYAAGALYSTVEDLYRWDQALDTEQLVSKKLREQMFTSFVSVPDSSGGGYGYGWFIGTEVNRPMVGHGGGIEGFSTNIFRFRDDKVTIIVLSNQENTDTGGISHILAQRVFGEN